MRRFVFLFLAFFGIGYLFFYGIHTPLATAIHAFHQQLIMHIVGWVIPLEQLKGFDIWISDRYKIVITPLCDGWLPLLFFWAFVWASPFSLVRQIVWTVVGYGAVMSVNALRIVLVVVLIDHYQNPSLFFYLHDVAGNVLLMVVVLLLAYLYGRHKP